MASASSHDSKPRTRADHRLAERHLAESIAYNESHMREHQAAARQARKRLAAVKKSKPKV